LLFTKVISILNEKGTGAETGVVPSISMGSKKSASQLDQKRDKLDFKAFYCAMTQIARRFYPEQSIDQALILLVKNVPIQIYCIES